MTLTTIVLALDRAKEKAIRTKESIDEKAKPIACILGCEDTDVIHKRNATLLAQATEMLKGFLDDNLYILQDNEDDEEAKSNVKMIQNIINAINQND